MKHTYIGCLLSLIIALPVIAVEPDYSGLSAEGYVRIGSMNEWMSATFNVRFAPREGHERSNVEVFVIARDSGDIVNFQGYDATVNKHFFCYIDHTDPKFHTALNIASSVGDGTRLYVTKLRDSNQCNSVHMDNRSIYLH